MMSSHGYISFLSPPLFLPLSFKSSLLFQFSFFLLFSSIFFYYFLKLPGGGSFRTWRHLCQFSLFATIDFLPAMKPVIFFFLFPSFLLSISPHNISFLPFLLSFSFPFSLFNPFYFSFSTKMKLLLILRIE